MILFTVNRTTVTVTVKLFSGLGKNARLKGYVPGSGISISVPSGTRVNRIVKDLGLPRRYSLAYFVNGQRAGLWKKLTEDCEVVCVRPSAGG